MALEFRENLVVQCQLVAADGAPIGRVECEDDRLATKFTKGEPLIRGDGKREIRRGRSACENVRNGSPPWCVSVRWNQSEDDVVYPLSLR